jgi:heterodisulfide reductase subunit A-like polyferredoxin
MQKARYIDIEKCTGCGECADVCPVVLSNEYDLGLSEKKATFKLYPQAIPGAYTIEKADKAPCRLACPAGLNVQGYVQMVGQGKYEEALKIIMEDLPLPGVLGRICPHGCEDACRRCEVDDPVAIRNLKRLAADKYDPRDIKIGCVSPREEKVAIIGSGPAGLSAAYQLARKGVLSTIYEALPKPGGMLRVGIPDHRLPGDILDKEIEVITNLGVEIKTNTPLGPEMTVDDLLNKGYKAVYLAMGAHKGLSLGIPGEKAKGVRQGVDFLREVNLEGKAPVGKKVAIVGGGNVAIDVSRSAVRLGAKEVNIIYRRTREEMPAWEEEIQAAEDEGVKITYLAAPQEILTQDGKVTGLRCIRMELGEPDSSGRRRPIPVPGSEFDIDIDQLIPAIGQTPDLSWLEEEQDLNYSKWGTVEVDPITYATGKEGVFAGGDVQTGPWVAIGAIAAGKEAAESIVRYLDGRDMMVGREPITIDNPEYRPIPKDISRQSRGKIRELEINERTGNFKEVELGYDEETGKSEANRCLNCGYCCECYQCVEACVAEAICHDQKPVGREINVGAVILSPGASTFDLTDSEEFYKYNSHPNIVTSTEFERILSATGPTMGHLVRPSDKKEPEKIAWLQCVGSRDTAHCNNGYCSSVCCMYAIKDAMIAKEHMKDNLDTAIFFMDIRTYGKEYEEYYNRAKDEHGVRFVRSRVHTIDPVHDSDDLILKYSDENGDIHQERFDMVVLSVGFEINQDIIDLSERIGISLNKYNFALSSTFKPVETTRPGVYVSGMFQGPKDIPGSVTEASAAACAASIDLSEARGTDTKSLSMPDEKDVSEEEPRIGVFVCDCGVNIAGVVDVPSVVEYAKTLPRVAFAQENLFSCSQDTQEKMKEVIKENKLNRVVVASCTPRTHEPLFQETLQACGLNKYLFEMANIRDQDSWVHGNDSESATNKAKDLVRMAVARAGLLTPLHEKRIPMTTRALIIGGGIAGMTAALSMADQGYEAVIVEKESLLGGLANKLTTTIEGDDIQKYLVDLIDRVNNHEKIQVLTETLVVGFGGFKGNFYTEVMVGPNMYSRKIEHGVVILATGAMEYTPNEYMYGEDHRVITQIDLSKRLEVKGADDLNQVVMIQCVGSRNEENPNCSRVCCQAAIKNALHIKDLNPYTEVWILYRDIRTYGLLEDYYTEARKRGVKFFRFNQDNPPRVESTDEGLSVIFTDHVLQRDIKVTADILTLSAGMVPSDTEELSSILKLPRNPEGYFIEAHVKLQPVDLANQGVFLCGTAHGPKLITESISQALAAASRASTFLSQPEIILSAVTAEVNPEMCASCLVCVRACPYNVPVINEEGVSYIDEALCHGCGTCASECPAKAIHLNWYEDQQIMSKLDSLLEGII